MGLNGALNVVLIMPKKNSTVMSLSRNHDPVTQNNPQTFYVGRKVVPVSKKVVPT